MAAVAASFMGSPAAGLAIMGVYTGALEFEDARKEGKDYVQSLTYGSVQGTIEGVTERFGLGPLMRMLKKQGGVGKEAIAYATRELIGENTAEFSQSMVSWYAGLDEVLANPKLSKKDRMWIQAQRQYVASVAALAMSGTTTAGKASFNVASQMTNLQMPPPKDGPVDRPAETRFQQKEIPEEGPKYVWVDDGKYTTFYPTGSVGMKITEPNNLSPLIIPNQHEASIEGFKKQSQGEAVDSWTDLEIKQDGLFARWHAFPFDKHGTKGWTTKLEKHVDILAKDIISTSGAIRQIEDILGFAKEEMNYSSLEEQQSLAWLLGTDNVDFKLHKFQEKKKSKYKYFYVHGKDDDDFPLMSDYTTFYRLDELGDIHGDSMPYSMTKDSNPERYKKFMDASMSLEDRFDIQTDWLNYLKNFWNEGSAGGEKSYTESEFNMLDDSAQALRIVKKDGRAFISIKNRTQLAELIVAAEGSIKQASEILLSEDKVEGDKVIKSFALDAKENLI